MTTVTPSSLVSQQNSGKKKKRSGSFVDNMKLPVHRWFRYSAGFSAEWVREVIRDFAQDEKEKIVFDPFAGSGTTLIASDSIGVKSVGIEAHYFVARVARTKLLWFTSTDEFQEKAHTILQRWRNIKTPAQEYPSLIHRCFDDETLSRLDKLKEAWTQENANTHVDALIWLAITAILRPASSAGTAQWQYILPNKTKRTVVEPIEAFSMQVQMMVEDMKVLQDEGSQALSALEKGDARSFPQIDTNSIDLVITSPPYANNYDYADATRFEMMFWGEIESWGDLHDSVRQYLVRSCSQHASKEKLVLDELLDAEKLRPIYDDLYSVCHELSRERLSHGGLKHYHTMVAAYFLDMAEMWHELRRVCKTGSEACFVIGDSAPYGVHVPVEKWLGKLAVDAGFKSYHFEKLRDRNIKWKNRKHRVPLQEGRLWLKG